MNAGERVAGLLRDLLRRDAEGQPVRRTLAELLDLRAPDGERLYPAAPEGKHRGGAGPHRLRRDLGTITKAGWCVVRGKGGRTDGRRGAAPAADRLVWIADVLIV